MARTIKSGKELSFNTARKCWCKNYQDADGKRKTAYFGKGTSVRDTRSYEAALQKYYPWQQGRETAAMLLRIHDLHKAVMEGRAPVTALGTSPWARRIVSDLRLKGFINDEGFYDADSTNITIRPPFGWDEGSEGTFQPQDQKPTRERTKTIQQHMDAWLAEEQVRLDAGQIKPNSLKSKKDGLKTMRKLVGSKTFGKSADVDALCMDYRQYLLKCMADADSDINSPNTVNDKTKFAGQFIEWCWKRSIIKDQPRTLDDMRAKLHVKKGGKSIPIEDVKKLWDAAGPRMKTMIALGLNCAFKPGDVNTLTNSHIKGDRLMGIRKKTEKVHVPMNYALWPITQKLVKANRETKGDTELLFINKEGGTVKGDTIYRLFKKVANKAGVEATFEQLRDTSIDLVKQDLYKQSGHMGMLQVFQAHKDSSTSQYYVSDDPRHVQVPVLDKIVLGLQKTYGLKLDASSVKAPAKKKAPPKTKA